MADFDGVRFKILYKVYEIMIYIQTIFLNIIPKYFVIKGGFHVILKIKKLIFFDQFIAIQILDFKKEINQSIKAGSYSSYMLTKFYNGFPFLSK
jgi:hypothetical protein